MLLGEILREKGMTLALQHSGSWKDLAIQKLKEYIAYLEWNGDGYFSFDQFKLWAMKNGLESPKSENAWGSLPRIACREGLIDETGIYTKSVIPSAHRRVIKLWRIV